MCEQPRKRAALVHQAAEEPGVLAVAAKLELHTAELESCLQENTGGVAPKA